MRARIYRPCKNRLYWAQIYDNKSDSWKTATLSCITKCDVKHALKQYARKHRKQYEEIII